MNIILKPTDACNCTCVYCSAESNIVKPRHRFDEEGLVALFERFRDYLWEDERNKITIVWHGGEPMIMGLKYYKQVREHQQRIFKGEMWRVKNMMQSNLTLLTPEWVPFLKEFLSSGGIGTSFDFHDGVRGLRNGDSLGEVWLNAVKMLLEAGIGVGAVYVTHRQALGKARELYYFFRNVSPKFGMRFNPMYQVGEACSDGSKGLGITSEEYGEFIVELFDVWRADGMRSDIAPVSEWYRAYRGDTSRLCCESSGNCQDNFFGINHEGAAFNCGRAIDNKLSPLGNIFSHSLAELGAMPMKQELRGRSEYLRGTSCKDCDYWDMCHGGCPSMALAYYGTVAHKDYFCDGRLRLFEHFRALYGPPAFLKEKPARREAEHEMHTAHLAAAAGI